MATLQMMSSQPLDSNPSPVSSLGVQEGGSHYKWMAIQPVEYIHRNGIPFIEGCIIKYVTRWRAKNGLEDLRKARHFLDMLIEFESATGPNKPVSDHAADKPCDS